MGETKQGDRRLFDRGVRPEAYSGIARSPGLTDHRDQGPGVINVYLQSDAARREAAQFRLTPEVRQVLVDLQRGDVPGIRLGATNNSDVVKFLQAVAGVPQTGKMDRVLEAFIRRVQSEARVDTESGEVVTKWDERRKDGTGLDEAKFARFKIDGNVRLSMRAFIFKARELGVLAEQEFKEILQPFGEAIKSRLNVFIDKASSGSDIQERAISDAVKKRWEGICKNDGIEIGIAGIIDFVNARWQEFALSGPIGELGARRILAALQTICRAESRGLGYSAANRGSSARGRYQFMARTVKECREAGIVGKRERFPACATSQEREKQDCVAIWLMGSKEKNRRILDNIVRGDVKGALSQMSYEWAGLPASNGRSRYHKKAGNKATITYQEAVSMMRVKDGDA